MSAVKRGSVSRLGVRLRGGVWYYDLNIRERGKGSGDRVGKWEDWKDEEEGTG